MRVLIEWHVDQQAFDGRVRLGVLGAAVRGVFLSDEHLLTRSREQRPRLHELLLEARTVALELVHARVPLRELVLEVARLLHGAGCALLAREPLPVQPDGRSVATASSRHETTVRHWPVVAPRRRGLKWLPRAQQMQDDRWTTRLPILSTAAIVQTLARAGSRAMPAPFQGGCVNKQLPPGCYDERYQLESLPPQMVEQFRAVDENDRVDISEKDFRRLFAVRRPTAAMRRAACGRGAGRARQRATRRSHPLPSAATARVPARVCAVEEGAHQPRDDWAG